MSYELKIGNHPAQADHPIKKGEKLFDNDGHPVPLFPKQKAIYLDGQVIAHVTTARKVVFLVPIETLTEHIRDVALSLVDAELGPPTGAFVIPKIETQAQDEDDTSHDDEQDGYS